MTMWSVGTFTVSANVPSRLRSEQSNLLQLDFPVLELLFATIKMSGNCSVLYSWLLGAMIVQSYLFITFDCHLMSAASSKCNANGMYNGIGPVYNKDLISFAC